MNVVGKLLHSDNTMFKVSLSTKCRRNKHGTRESFCPLQQHLPASFYTNLEKLSSAPHVSYLDFSLGWLVSFVCPYFLLSSSRFYFKKKVVQLGMKSGVQSVRVCLSWVPAWEWMVMRHRLRSQRETQTLMALQVEATSREEEWCQQQRLDQRSYLGILNAHLPRFTK